MGNVIFLSFLSVLNPTLIAVTTVMLLLPNPGRLMLGYWLGDYFYRNGDAGGLHPRARLAITPHAVVLNVPFE